MVVAVIECLQGRAAAGAGGGQKLLALSVMIPLTHVYFLGEKNCVHSDVAQI